MSKRRLGNEIDKLSDDILRDLEPGQRLQLLLRARADENEQWIDRLVETCPRYDYTATDHAFTDRVQLAQWIAQQAVYELHTTYLHYKYTEQQQLYTRVLDYERDEELSDEDLDQVSERADELRVLFATLYTDYHAYQRFATEILDVDPETWLAFHPEGPTVFEVVADLIDDQRQIEFAESHLNGLLEKDEEEEVETETTDPDQTTPGDDHELTLEDMAETNYEALASGWKDAIAGIP